MVMNAIVDAHAHAPIGAAHLDVPATPERLWTACRQARDGREHAHRDGIRAGERAAKAGSERPMSAHPGPAAMRRCRTGAGRSASTPLGPR